jgi:hypothetical protein
MQQAKAPEDWWSGFTKALEQSGDTGFQQSDYGKNYLAQTGARSSASAEAGKWVEQAYSQALNRAPQPGEADQWIARLMSGENPDVVRADFLNTAQQELYGKFEQNLRPTKEEPFKRIGGGESGPWNEISTPNAYGGQDYFNRTPNPNDPYSLAQNYVRNSRGEPVYVPGMDWSLGLGNFSTIGPDYSLKQPVQDILGAIGWQDVSPERLRMAEDPQAMYETAQKLGYGPDFEISPNTSDAEMAKIFTLTLADQNGYDTSRLNALFQSPGFQQWEQESAQMAGKRNEQYRKATTGPHGLQLAGIMAGPLMGVLGPALAGALGGGQMGTTMAGALTGALSGPMGALTGALGSVVPNFMPAALAPFVRAAQTILPAVKGMTAQGPPTSLRTPYGAHESKQMQMPHLTDWASKLQPGAEDQRNQIPPEWKAQVGTNVPTGYQMEQWRNTQDINNIRKAMMPEEYNGRPGEAGGTPFERVPEPAAPAPVQAAVQNQPARVLNDLQIPGQAKVNPRVTGAQQAFVRRPNTVAGITNAYGHQMLAAKRPKVRTAQTQGMSVRGGTLSVRDALKAENPLEQRKSK